MPYLGGTVTNPSNVGIWGITVRTPGVLAGAQTDANGNWLWDASVLGVKFVGQPLEFDGAGFISRTVSIPPVNQPDGGVWMTVVLQIDTTPVPPSTSSH